jgi:hypothetical protein
MDDWKNVSHPPFYSSTGLLLYGAKNWMFLSAPNPLNLYYKGSESCFFSNIFMRLFE